MRTLIVAPHADDELLGCGGTMLRRGRDGVLGWLLMTALTSGAGCDDEKIEQRANEIEAVRQGLCISHEHLYELGLPTTALDCVSMADLVGQISKVIKEFEPEEVFLPYPGDVHSDHRIAFEAASSCTKWFRYPNIKRVLVYETLSETDFSIDPRYSGFRPNVFVDTTDFLEQKISLMGIYKSEMGDFPFPRSEEAIRALAKMRGAQAGFESAESFMLLVERL